MNRRSPVGLALVLVLGSAGSVMPQPPTFSTAIEAVRVDVLVTENGEVVRGLRPVDFEVLDDGVRQDVDLVTFEQLPLNVTLALDLSHSVSGERLDHLRSAGHALLDGLRSEDQAALLTFSHMVTLRESQTADIGRVRTALDQVRPLGDTALVDGVYSALLQASPGFGRNLLLVFSDGLDTSSWLRPDDVLESAQHASVVVYGVSVRGAGKSPFLADLSERTGGTNLEVESTNDLSRTFVSILNEFRERYLVSYSPRGVSRAGWHQLEVRVKGRRATVKARAGYVAGSRWSSGPRPRRDATLTNAILCRTVEPWTLVRGRRAFPVPTADRRWSSRLPPTPVPLRRTLAPSPRIATDSWKGSSPARSSMRPSRRSTCGTWR